MSKLVEFGAVSTETKATFFQGKFVDGAKGQMNGSGPWYYKTSDSDLSQPLRTAPVG
jgi:hypothetical protein